MEKANFNKLSKQFAFASDKMNKYCITFQTAINSELSIIAIQDNHQKQYSTNISLKFLKNNKYLSSLDTIDEIFDEIINKINYKSPSLYEENNNLKIVIDTLHSKYKEITFELKEKEKSASDKIEELYLLITQLKEKEKQQDEKIKILEEKLEKLEKNNRIKEKDILLVDNESIILKDNNNYTMCLKNWINPNKNIRFKILYRMSRDSDSISRFHQLSDNQGPTVSLYLLDDGIIVGGYTSLSWNTSGGWLKDNETFVFNLNKNLRCDKKKKNTESIFCSISYSGFYGTLGYYEDSKNSMKNLFYFNSDSTFNNGNKILDYNKRILLEPKEVEVLKVIFS